jgi:hypothetical protein
MYVVCYFGEHMSCRLINIYFAMQIKQTTNKSCQKNLFSCKKQEKQVCFVVNQRFRAVFHRFSAGKPVRIQIDLNRSNQSVFTGFHRFTNGKLLSMGSGFCRLNGFVNRGCDALPLEVVEHRCGKLYESLFLACYFTLESHQHTRWRQRISCLHAKTTPA